jgi:PAS domain S-box-containing protein
MNNYINKITSIHEGLLSSYIKVGWFIIPLLIFKLVFHYFGISELVIYQLVITTFGLFGLISFQLFKKNKFLKSNFYIIQASYLVLIMILEFMWYYYEPDVTQLISLILGITVTGVALIKPRTSVIFYLSSILLLISINVISETNSFNNLHYFIFSGIFIVTFNFWRENINNLLRLSQSSYRNIFSDTDSLIFVINKKNYDIIELNIKAQNYVKDHKLKSNNFLNIFYEEQENKILIKNLNLLKSNSNDIQFETELDADNINYIPKQFNIKLSTFFNDEVIIIQGKSIIEKKENEKQLIETKENITTILDNINSFIYNVMYYENEDIQLRFISSKAADILNVEIDELIINIKSKRTQYLVHPDDLAYVKIMVKNATSTLEIQKLEYRLVINDKIKWVEETIFPTKEKDGIVHFGIVTDVTENRKNQVLLLKSENKYRQLFEKSLAGIYKTTEDGDIIDANIAFSKLLGFNNVEELKYRNIKDFYFETEDRTSYINLLKKDKSTSNYITVLKTINGEKIITSNNAFIHKEEGIVYINGTLIDVTGLQQATEELKKNEIRLKDSQKSFESIVENSPGSLFIFNVNNELVFTNNKAEILSQNYLNNSSTEFEKIFKKEHRFIIENLFSEADNPTQSYTQIVLENKDLGLKENYSIQVVKVNYNNEKSNLLLFRNVTIEHEFSNQKLRAELAEETNISLEKEIVQHKSTQKLLIENRNFTESLFDSSLDMIIASDTNNIITLVNKAATTKFGYSKEELIGKNLSLIVQSSDIHLDVQKTIIKSNKYIGEVENISKEGEKFKSYLSATTIINDKGEVTGFMGISRDLSEINEIQNIITTQSSVIESLFQNESNIFIWNLNRELELISFNKGIFQFFNKIGIQLNSGFNFLNQIKDAIDTDYYEVIFKHFNNVLKGEKSNFIINVKDENEVNHWADIHLTPVVLPDGKIQDIMCLGTDITEQINKNIIIERSEKNVKAVLNAIPDLMLNISKNGTILNFTTNTDHQKRIVSKFIPEDGVIIGKKIEEILVGEQEFSKKVLEFINQSIDTEKVISHQFSHLFGDDYLYFENRYSKINNNEAIVVVRDTTLEIVNENNLKDSLKEKEILLKEVHHRVKNNLQIINSILNLQSSYIEDEKTLEIINESQNRIRSMSYIHESLYQTSNFSSINFKEYIENLLSNLVYSYQIGTKIKILKNIENIDLSLDQAIPCGLILNELITNALKYAYDIDEEGEVFISIEKIDSKIQVIVQDYGIGLPKNFDIETADSLGLSLVHTLTEQIDGELIIKSDGGTKILIIFEML